MHIRNVAVVLLICVTGSCATVLIPPLAAPATAPLGQASCAALPEGLTLYAGVTFAEVERQGRFPMQHPQRRYLKTSNHLWRNFRDGLEPADLIFEYVQDESFEAKPFHHGGLSAFRGGCTIKIEQVWIT